MNGLLNYVLDALMRRYGNELSEASGMPPERLSQAIVNRDERGLQWLPKAVDGIRASNPQLFAQMQRMAGWMTPFRGSR